MATYQTKFSEGDSVLYEGRYTTIMKIRRDGEAEYVVPMKGKMKTVDAALFDRDATLHKES